MESVLPLENEGQALSLTSRVVSESSFMSVLSSLMDFLGGLNEGPCLILHGPYSVLNAPSLFLLFLWSSKITVVKSGYLMELTETLHSGVAGLHGHTDRRSRL